MIIDLLNNIDKIHSTELGIQRIKRNLNISTDDVINYCIKIVKDNNSVISKEGKNWYVTLQDIKLTINSYSYTIITAHKIKY